ncbi:hypothetical protein [Gillisia limnaea]|uniref:Uncharacterized protein n=1 Tax=Gillisia limnaea (strain DSM 15749 / LMG 21470 / R-8282) TaxID=865937 RepID=H2BXI2_GILLR|nr:hypothetical protein [Gillisia limnaea]EHQ02064.1 hypothetical protein Gilli_1406 [Gillisia limnaea DSM 15749]
MRYEIFSDLGGFLWWLTIKFGKTDLKKEHTPDKWARNLFFLIVLGLVIGFISVKFF